YPKAQLYAAPGVFSRVPELPRGREIGESPPDEWRGALQVAILRPTQEVSEVALFHRQSATLVVTDLAFHMVRFPGVAEKLAWRLSGVPRGFGPSRTARKLLLRDREEAVPFLKRVDEWPFERILVAHGDVVETGAHAAFRRAFAAYLP